MGKPIALRRLLPVVRVDYVRINGTDWVEDPENRFATTLDFLEPIIRLIPKLESAILDDMPHHFRLEEGQSQRSDQPILPQKVIREATVNALMHRDYQTNQPILIVRYSNRLEIRNPGYSLKPENELGEMGSRLRNPIISAVLYDLSFAETKGSGIRTMQRLLKQAGLTPPVFISNRESNQFSATYLLHQLLSKENLEWLKQFERLNLSDDEAKALIIIKEIGAIDNAALRAITDLDTLASSQLLRHLCQLKLIEKGGKSRATHYRPFGQLVAFNMKELDSNMGELDSILQQIPLLKPKTRKEKPWPIILALLALRMWSAEELSKLLGRKPEGLKALHLNSMRKQGLINYLYPEVINHPNQAYEITATRRDYLLTIQTRKA